MPNPLETLQDWLVKPPPIPNSYTTVAVTLYMWNQYDPPSGLSDYAYFGLAQNASVGARPAVGDMPGVLGVPGLKVCAAALTFGTEQYFFLTEMTGNAAGQVSFEGLTIQSPDSPAVGTLDSGPEVISSDDGSTVELDFQVTFQQTGVFGDTKECHLLMTESSRIIVQSKKIPPFKKEPIV